MLRQDFIQAEGICFSAPGEESDLSRILTDVTLRVAEGEQVALLGPSGCGKTTFMNIIAGLETPKSGWLRVGGERPRADLPWVSVGFARDVLLPWRNALENVALPLEIRGVPRRVRESKAREILETVGLGLAVERYRAELSHGMRQRVALARALITDPRLLLLDEPFGALDAQTRVDMQSWLLTVLRERRCTVVLVTHDIPEAITCADRVLVMGPRPASIERELCVRFGWPRDAMAIRMTREFQDLESELWSALERPTKVWAEERSSPQFGRP